MSDDPFDDDALSSILEDALSSFEEAEESVGLQNVIHQQNTTIGPLDNSTMSSSNQQAGTTTMTSNMSSSSSSSSTNGMSEEEERAKVLSHINATLDQQDATGGTLNQEEEKLASDFLNGLENLIEELLVETGTQGVNETTTAGDTTTTATTATTATTEGQGDTTTQDQDEQTKRDNDTIAETLKMLKNSADKLEEMEQSGAGGQMDNEAMMAQIASQFDALGDNPEFQAVMEGMMKQLLSKEIMYEPMKQLYDLYPDWLEENKGKIDDEEMKRLTTQFELIKQLVHVYENDENNFQLLLQLMQDVQEYGQPPAELVQRIAPDVQFDEQGLPIIPEGMEGEEGGNGGTAKEALAACTIQ